MNVFERGREIRVVGATHSNEYSSRSHAIFLLTSTVFDRNTATEYVSQLYLCDLAGSERVSKTNASGIRLQEAGKINHSILTLGKVIVALSESKDSSDAKTHIPYRDSKLTRFLCNAFGGNGISVLLMCVSPDFVDSGETDSTLQLGARSQAIKNTVVANVRYRLLTTHTHSLSLSLSLSLFLSLQKKIHLSRTSLARM